MTIVILTFVLGLVLMATGWMLWRQNKIQVIRERHHRNVKDKEGYCRVMGKTLMAMGGLIILSGIMGLIPGLPLWLGTLIFYAGIVASVIAILVIQFRYNGGI